MARRMKDRENRDNNIIYNIATPGASHSIIISHTYIV